MTENRIFTYGLTAVGAVTAATAAGLAWKGYTLWNQDNVAAAAYAAVAGVYGLISFFFADSARAQWRDYLAGRGEDTAQLTERSILASSGESVPNYKREDMAQLTEHSIPQN